MNIICTHTTSSYPWHSFEFAHEDVDGTTTKTHLLALSEIFPGKIFSAILTKNPIKFSVSSKSEVYVASLQSLKNLFTEEAKFLSFISPEDSQEWVEMCLAEITLGTPIDTLLEREIVLPFKNFEKVFWLNEGDISAQRSFSLKASPRVCSPGKSSSCCPTPETHSYADSSSPLKLPPFLNMNSSACLKAEERETENPKLPQDDLHSTIQGCEGIERSRYGATSSDMGVSLQNSPIDSEQRDWLFKPFFSKKNYYESFKHAIFQERLDSNQSGNLPICDQYENTVIYESLVEIYINRFTKRQGLDLCLTEEVDLHLPNGQRLRLPPGPLPLALGIDLFEQEISLPLQNKLNFELAPLIPSLRIAALIVIIKMADDLKIENSRFLSYLASSPYTLKDINTMELAFLIGIDWDLSLSEAKDNLLIREAGKKEEIEKEKIEESKINLLDQKVSPIGLPVSKDKDIIEEGEMNLLDQNAHSIFEPKSSPNSNCSLQ